MSRTTKEMRSALLEGIRAAGITTVPGTKYASKQIEIVFADLEDAEQRIIQLENRLMCFLTPGCKCPKHTLEKLAIAIEALESCRDLHVAYECAVTGEPSFPCDCGTKERIDQILAKVRT